MNTALPIADLPLYVSSSINTAYFTVVYLGNYLAGDYNENVGSHCGIDIDTTKYSDGQTDILAVMEGTVVLAELSHASYGNYLVLRHDNCPSADDPTVVTTYYSCYLHLSSIAVSLNQIVSTGTKIGVSGSTGNSTAPHLHFQIDCVDAPFHPYWPFTTAEYQAAGYSSLSDAVNHGFHLEQARQYTINPLLYIQTYLDSPSTGDQIFSDISDTDQDYTAIKYLKEYGIIQGYSDGSFRPENSINRAELLKMAFKSFNYPPRNFTTSSFPDVQTTDWFFPYVETAKQDNLIAGYADGTFQPANDITKAETIKILLNTAKISVPTTISSSYFADVSLSAWYTRYINTAYERNIIDHTTQFEPNIDATRRLVARWCYRMIT